MLIQANAARLFKAIQHNQELQLKSRAIKESNTFVKLASKQGYHFDTSNLETEVDHLSEEEIAAIFNPGVGPRHHLIRK